MGSSTGGVPPGFRFHPTDEELLHYYLKKKVTFQKFDMEVIREVDLNKMEPWELQERCRIGSAPQHDWYFFSHKDRKYPTGSRTNRATNAGFWKATGRDKCIRNTYKKIGMRKTLVFYRGRAPHGQKTDWIMHEYRLEDGDDAQGNSNEDGWVVCRVFKKKNLFKVGNEGGTSMNSSDQQLNTSSTTNQPRNFLRDNPYLLRQHHDHQQPFELNKTTELALRYPHLATPQYHSLFQSQTVMSNKPLALGYDYSSASTAAAFPSDQSPVMAKQLLMSSTRDCESAGSESLRYQTCEPGLEAGTCEPGGGAVHPHQQQMVAAAAAARDDQGLTEWAMLDRIVTPHEDHGNNAASTVHPINHLSSRGEMDFWGYGK